MMDWIRVMELPEPCDNCGHMPISDTIPKELYKQYGECHCEEADE